MGYARVWRYTVMAQAKSDGKKTTKHTHSHFTPPHDSRPCSYLELHACQHRIFANLAHPQHLHPHEIGVVDVSENHRLYNKKFNDGREWVIWVRGGGFSSAVIIDTR